MKIKRLEINNFKGIKALSFEMPHIIALCEKNGAGKTSVLEALRFALTGEEPEGEIIRFGSLSTQVTISLEDDKGEVFGFTRIKEVDKPSKFKINGKTTTQKSLNETIEAVTGLEMENIKILSSSEIVGIMKPAEFASLILKYVPEKMSLEKIMEFIPESTPGMVDIIDANLPTEGIDIAMLDEFDAVARATRKELKSSLQAKQLMYDKHIKEAPAQSAEDVEAKLKELLATEANYKIYLEKVKAFEELVKRRESNRKRIEELKEELGKNSSSRPDPEKAKALEAKRTDVNSRIMSQQSALAGINTAIATLSSTLKSIDSSTCPISPLISCKTDKTVAKKEIEETIAATSESRSSVEEEISLLKKELEEISNQLNAEKQNAMLYEQKLFLNKQILALEESLGAEPVKPEEIEAVDVSAEKYKLEQTLRNIQDFNEGVRLLAQIKQLTTEVKDYDSIVKLLAEKGAIRTGVVSSYLGIFEDICNERSKKIRPEFNFRFAPENGVTVYMENTKTGMALTIKELSGGERAYMIYILLDMLNQLVGTKVLVLDELSVMDESTFNSLLDLILMHSAEYDHIILSAVNHTEMLNGFKEREINPFSF